MELLQHQPEPLGTFPFNLGGVGVKLICNLGAILDSSNVK